MAASKLQKHFFKLLCEIDDICSEQGIPYSLAEHSAWDAVKFHEYHGGMYDTCIMMTKEAADRFGREIWARALSSRMIVKDGAGKIKEKSLRYIDTNTTLYDFKNPNRFEYSAVGVEIRILMPSGNLYETVNPEGKVLKLPMALFESYGKAEIEGREFPLVFDYDAYFSKLVSKDWGKKKYPYPVPKEPNPAFNLIYSEDLSYTDFFKRPLVKRATSLRGMAVRALYDRWRKKSYDGPANAFERKYKKYLTLTEDRFVCWEHYYSQKGELMSIAANDPKSAELRERLELFVKTIDKHYKNGLGFSFDEDILQVTLPVLEEEKGHAYVEKYLQQIPCEHRRESVAQLLIRKGAQHPLS